MTALEQWSGWAVPTWTNTAEGTPHYFETAGNEEMECGNSLCGRLNWDAHTDDEFLGDTLMATTRGFPAPPCDECLRVLAERKCHESAHHQHQKVG